MDVITEYLKSRRKAIQKQIDHIKSQYLKGKLSKVDFGIEREQIDIQLEIFRDMAEDIGIDWETL